ncbi:hypothetical protein Tco_0088725 [Tanacetum coccineum]
MTVESLDVLEELEEYKNEEVAGSLGACSGADGSFNEPTAKGVGLRVANSHSRNHPEDGFAPLKTIRRLLVAIGRRSHSGFKGDNFEPERRRCGLSAKELNEFLSSYPIPSEYDVILPTSTQTIFDAPPGYVGLHTHLFLLPTSGYLLLTFSVSGLKPSWRWQQWASFDPCGAAKDFIYTKMMGDKVFLPKEPSLGFGTGSPSASVNTELRKDAEEPEV